jgi:uncharacterized protein YciI
VGLFAVTTVFGPSWNASLSRREQREWDGHATFMDGLVDDGFVFLGGPIGDSDRNLLVVEATDEREIETRMGEDPWASMGLLRIASIEPWTIWLDGRKRQSSC